MPKKYSQMLLKFLLANDIIKLIYIFLSAFLIPYSKMDEGFGFYSELKYGVVIIEFVRMPLCFF